jgi:DNA-binding XRE family transcriptional regulator
MVSVARFKTPSGDEMVVLAEEDYRTLKAAAEDTADLAAVREFDRKLAAGDEELIPAEVVDRILAGENRVRVWREHRGMSVAVLARVAGITPAYLSQIETGKRDGTVETYRKLAAMLRVTIDELAG